MENKRLWTALLLTLALLTITLRIWRLDIVPGFRDSEMFLVPASFNYNATGHLSPDNWYSPPFRHILMNWSIAIFGNNPYGWRMRNAVFGALSIFILYMVGKEVFNDRRIAFLAALLLSMDALHLRYSRVSHGEIVATAFFLASVYAVFRGSRSGPIGAVVAAGSLLGLATAIKWYFIPAHLILFIYALASIVPNSRSKPWSAVAVVLSFTLLPISIYALTFYKWVGRGFGLVDLFYYNIDAYRVMQALTIDAIPGFYPDMIRHSGGVPGWFVRPVLFGGYQWSDGRSGVYDVIMNNFPVVFLIFPSIVYLLCRSLTQRHRRGILVVVLFLSMYLQFIFVKRPVWIYSSIPLLPCGYLATAFLMQSLLEKFKAKESLYAVLAAVIVLWGLYLFPFVNSFTVPEFLYAPLRSLGYIEGAF